MGQQLVQQEHFRMAMDDWLVVLQAVEEKEELGTLTGMRCVRQNAAGQVAQEGLLLRGRCVEEGTKFDESWKVALCRLLNIKQLVSFSTTDW